MNTTQKTLYYFFFACLISYAGCKTKNVEPDKNNTPSPTQVCPTPAALDMSGAANWGDGTPASCTQAALQTLLDEGGKIKCNCGPSAFTLTLSSTLNVPSRKQVIFDGANLVTISGNNSVRIFDKQAPANQNEGTLFGIQNIKLINGRANNELGGAAILGRYFGSLSVINVRFEGNQSQLSHSDACGAVHTGGYKEVLFAGCVFVNNKAANGGAVGTIGSAQSFINCSFEDNQATGTGGTFGQGGSGGAIYVDGIDQNGVKNSMSLCGCSFKNNKASHEGGAASLIFYANKSSRATINKCIFDGNSCAPATGGGLYFLNGDLELTNTTFSNNTSTSQGGGAWLTNYNATIINCTFASNNALNGNDGLGGGLALSGGATKNASITNCTFAENRAGNFASAIFNGGNLSLQNTLFYKDKTGTGNQSNPYGGGAINKNSNIDVKGGNMQFPSTFAAQFGTETEYWLQGKQVLTTDAMLVGLADNGGFSKTMALPVGSPAINTGTKSGSPDQDQRGQSRDATPDIGAFEKK